MSGNFLFYGDNLDVLRRYIKDESVDLVYLDPPFNSNASYNVLFAEHGEKAASQIQAFEDTWQWDQESARLFFETVQAGGAVGNALQAFHTLLGESNMMAYLAMMAPRLVELRRVLKPTGSLYLHCDQSASHYLKLLMDSVFGRKNFRNEIVWDYSFRLMDLPRFYNKKHDTILFYSKTANNFFSMPKTEWTKEDLLKSRKQAIHVDDDGVEWIWMPGGKGHSKNKLRRVDEILAGGKAVSDVWSIPIISSSAKERLGYPTQKPEVLLERIIEASSQEGEVVLDPFCGCGTTIAVAQRLKRKWIGIDITHLAVNLMKHRLQNAFGEDIKDEYEVIGEPTDLGGAKQLAKEDPYQFQWWALGLVGARPVEQKKGADKGIDGRIPFSEDPSFTNIQQIVLSVKAGKTGRAHVHELRGVMEREGAAIGVLISMQKPTRPMREEAASAGMYESDWGGPYPRLQLLSVEDLLEGKGIESPPLGHVSQVFKKAPEAKRKSEQMKLGED